MCYGLAVQCLKKGCWGTNLLPKEIVKDRIIKSKKPWAVAAAAVLLLGCTLSIGGHAMVLRTVDKDRFSMPKPKAESVKKEADNYKSQTDAAKGAFNETEKIGKNVVRRVSRGEPAGWNCSRPLPIVCLATPRRGLAPEDPKEDVEERNKIQITSLDCKQIDKASWTTFLKYVASKTWYEPATPAEDKLWQRRPMTPAAGRRRGRPLAAGQARVMRGLLKTRPGCG